MSGYHKTIIVGLLGHSPSRSEMPSGDAVVEFSVAVSDKKDFTEWYNVKAFSKNAENIEKFFSKGSWIVIEGHNQTRKWEKDGQKKYKTELIVDRWAFCGEKKEKTHDPNKDYEPPTEDDNIPF